MKKAVVFFADGTEECEALLVVDLLRRANVQVTVASASGRLELETSHGIRMTADALAEDLDYTDTDLVCCQAASPAPPTWRRIRRSPLRSPPAPRQAKR